MKQMQIMHHAPTLATILMVEKALIESEQSAVTLAELKRALPKQVNHHTLKTILAYLEESNKIVYSGKGITWIHEINPSLKKAISRGLEL